MDWEPDEKQGYESVAKKKARAAKVAEELSAAEGPLEPAVTKGKALSSTFWGQAWNRNLERYHHYEQRLPAGRSYVRNGCVIDLKIHRGQIEALVSDAELCRVRINIKPLDKELWQEIKKKCAGQITSLVGLLQGKLPESVMAAVTHEEDGLFPTPHEIKFICDCPDYADMCPHGAAAAYGVGARLDDKPELLFLLRGVEHTELVSELDASGLGDGNASGDEIDASELGDIFGIDLERS